MWLLPVPQGARKQHTDLFFDEPAGGEVGDEATIDIGVESKVKLLQGLLASEVCSAKGRDKSLLGSPGDLISDDGCQEIHVGELFFDGLATARSSTPEMRRFTALLTSRRHAATHGSR
jgi:hypothetical protein